MTDTRLLNDDERAGANKAIRDIYLWLQPKPGIGGSAQGKLEVESLP